MPLLSAPVPLDDVLDVEAFSRETINRQLRAWRAHLVEEDYEDLLCFLLETSCTAANRYEADRA